LADGLVDRWVYEQTGMRYEWLMSMGTESACGIGCYGHGLGTRRADDDCLNAGCYFGRMSFGDHAENVM
jgi:hypothetical protein